MTDTPPLGSWSIIHCAASTDMSSSTLRSLTSGEQASICPSNKVLLVTPPAPAALPYHLPASQLTPCVSDYGARTPFTALRLAPPSSKTRGLRHGSEKASLPRRYLTGLTNNPLSFTRSALCHSCAHCRLTDSFISAVTAQSLLSTFIHC